MGFPAFPLFLVHWSHDSSSFVCLLWLDLFREGEDFPISSPFFFLRLLTGRLQSKLCLVWR